MASRFAVRVQTADFDIAAEIHDLTRDLTEGEAEGAAETGAVASFTGLVRGGGGLRALELEHYPGMTERALEDIVAEARERWPLDGVRIVHRVGKLRPGARIVLALTASRHRRAALEAVDFLMDRLKTRAPFWKREDGPDGARWVEARQSDATAAERWG